MEAMTIAVVNCKYLRATCKLAATEDYRVSIIHSPSDELVGETMNLKLGWWPTRLLFLFGKNWFSRPNLL